VQNTGLLLEFTIGPPAIPFLFYFQRQDKGKFSDKCWKSFPVRSHSSAKTLIIVADHLYLCSVCFLV